MQNVSRLLRQLKDKVSETTDRLYDLLESLYYYCNKKVLITKTKKHYITRKIIWHPAGQSVLNPDARMQDNFCHARVLAQHHRWREIRSYLVAKVVCSVGCNSKPRYDLKRPATKSNSRQEVTRDQDWSRAPGAVRRQRCPLHHHAAQLCSCTMKKWIITSWKLIAPPTCWWCGVFNGCVK